MASNQGCASSILAGRSMKILIIEDNQDIAELYNMTFMMAGHTCTNICDGDDVLQMNLEEYDGAITDYMMRMKNFKHGGEVAEYLIEHGLPTVLVTASSTLSNADVQVPVMRKPVTPDALLEMLGLEVAEFRRNGKPSGS